MSECQSWGSRSSSAEACSSRRQDCARLLGRRPWGMAGYVNVRAYAELTDFLGPESRWITVQRPFRRHQTVKDVLEAMGIPHTEVDLILVNGNAEDFAHRPTSGDHPMPRVNGTAQPPGPRVRGAIAQTVHDRCLRYGHRACLRACAASCHARRRRRHMASHSIQFAITPAPTRHPWRRIHVHARNKPRTGLVVRGSCSRSTGSGWRGRVRCRRRGRRWLIGSRRVGISRCAA
jgi:Mut7-C ubiquitin